MPIRAGGTADVILELTIAKYVKFIKSINQWSLIQMAEDKVKIESKRVNEQPLIFTPPLNIVLTVNAM